MTIENTHATVGVSTRQRRRWLLTAAVVLLLAGIAGWLYGRQHLGSTPIAAPAPVVAVAAAASSAAPAAASQLAASAPARAAPAVAYVPARPPPMPEESPAELLQLVQKGLGSGSPKDALRAAQALNSCAGLAWLDAQSARAGMQGQNARDTRHNLPPDLDKVVESMGGFTNANIERFDQEKRRCQVFDADTLARRGELFKRAYEGDPQGASQAYLNYLTLDDQQGKPDPQLLASVREDARRNLQSGDFGALASWGFGGDMTAEKLGFSLVEARAYGEAFYRIQDELAPGSSASSRELAAKIAKLGLPRATLTAEQQREVDALAQRIHEAWRRRQRQPAGG